MESAKKLNDQLRNSQVQEHYEEIYNKVNEFLNENKPDEAKAWLLEQIKSDQNSGPYLYCQLGVVYSFLDDFVNAEKSFLKSIEFGIKIPEPFYNLGVLYQNQKEYEKALTNYKQVILINDKDTETYELMGNCCIEMSNTVDAIAFYDTALRMNPQSLNAAINLAQLYLEENENQQAIEVLKIALVSYPTQKELHFALGDIYKNSKEFEHAIGHYRKVLSLDEENSRAYFELGYCCYQLGLINQSIPLLAKAYKLDTHITDALFFLGKAYEHKKNKDMAISVYENWLDAEKSNINLRPTDYIAQFNNVCNYVSDYYHSNQDEKSSSHYRSLIIEENTDSDFSATTSFRVDD